MTLDLEVKKIKGHFFIIHAPEGALFYCLLLSAMI